LISFNEFNGFNEFNEFNGFNEFNVNGQSLNGQRAIVPNQYIIY